MVRAYLPEVSSPKAKTSPEWLCQPLKVSQYNGRIEVSSLSLAIESAGWKGAVVGSYLSHLKGGTWPPLAPVTPS